MKGVEKAAFDITEDGVEINLAWAADGSYFIINGRTR